MVRSVAAVRGTVTRSPAAAANITRIVTSLPARWDLGQELLDTSVIGGHVNQPGIDSHWFRSTRIGVHRISVLVLEQC